MAEQTVQNQFRRTWRDFWRMAYRSSFLLVPLLIALLIFQTPYVVYGLIGVVLFFLLRWLAEGVPFPASPVNIVLVVFLLTFGVGLLLSPASDKGVGTAAHLVAGILIFFVILDWGQSVDRLWSVAALLVSLGIAFALAAPFATEWAQDKLFQFPLFYDIPFPHFAESSNANNVAGGLEVAVPFAVALVGSSRVRLRLLGAIGLLPLVGMLLLLQSRGALLALGVGSVAYAMLYGRRFLTLLLLTLVGGLVLTSLIGNPLSTQPLYPKNLETGPGTVNARVQIWEYAVPLLVGAPLGLGVGGFHVYAQTQLAQVLATTQQAHAHNLFLEVGLDSGIAGLGAFLILWGYAVNAALHAYHDPRTRRLAMGLLAAFVVILTHGMFDLIFWDAKPGIFLWATFAIAMALHRLKTDSGVPVAVLLKDAG